MREIKFEICTRNKDSGVLSKKIYPLDTLLRVYIPSDEVVVYKRQYINLKTGEGVEVYDGDIIQYSTHKVNAYTGLKVPNSELTQTKVVEWTILENKASWQLRLIDTTEIYPMTGEKFGIGNIDYGIIGIYLNNAKVIGNIYENPELLK